MHRGRVGERIPSSTSCRVFGNILVHEMDDAHAGGNTAGGTCLQEDGSGDPFLAGAHGESGIDGGGGVVETILRGPAI